MPRLSQGSSALALPDFDRLSRLIESELGIRMPPQKRNMLEARILRRCRQLGLAGPRDYCNYLFSEATRDGELVHFLDIVTTNVTYFFREPVQLDVFRTQLLDGVIRRAAAEGRPVRIWSAACSTGEELWTLGMMVEDARERLNLRVDVELLGTDISTRVLDRAVNAVYSATELERITPTFHRRFCLRTRNLRDPRVRIAPRLRALASFKRLNLMASTYAVADEQDIVFLRNVLIYFDRPTQEKVVRNVAAHLRPGGLLCLGLTETFYDASLGLSHIGRSIYRSAGKSMSRRIRVLIVDDSARGRRALTQVLAAEEDIEVMGTASNPFEAARQLMKELPDVILLDLEMPGMDGVTFLRKLMEQHPIPTVICSSPAEAGSPSVFAALEAGAVDIVMKPGRATKASFDTASARIGEVVRAAAGAKVVPRPASARLVSKPSARPQGATASASVLPASASVEPPRRRHASLAATEKIVVVGASAGGTEALRVFLQGFDHDGPPIAVVQHMPEGFTERFARRLDELCPMHVKEAAHGDVLSPGQVLIAPGNRHMVVRRSGTQYHVEILDTPLVNRHRPSVDVLFDSAAECLGARAIGVIMTGMGDDGAAGLRAMRDAGAHTLAEDEATCVVYGMPREALRRGGAVEVLPLDTLSVAVAKACS